MASQIATEGLWKRGETRAAPRKNRPRSAIAKNTREPVIIEALSPLKAATTTAAAITAAPALPSSGMRAATLAAMSLEPAICAGASAYRKPTLTTRYTSMTHSAPAISARGRLRCGSLISPGHGGRVRPAVVGPQHRNQRRRQQRQGDPAGQRGREMRAAAAASR